MLKIKNNQYYVFDLDDTLYKEIDFLKSAYQFISEKLEPYTKSNIYDEMINCYFQNKSTFDYIKEKYIFPFSVEDLVKMYREHPPKLDLPSESKKILDFLKNKNIKMGLITDGRSLSQRNKIIALNIEYYFEKIIISDEIGYSKPSLQVFKEFNDKNYEYFYIGDNVSKDFITPNKIGWKTICLVDDGQNIHKQDFNLKSNFLPQYKISSLDEIFCLNNY